MKKFSKLLAVLLAMALIICPMTSAIVANAESTTGNEYKMEKSGDVVTLTITSPATEGFMVYKASVAFGNGSIDTAYTQDGYNKGIKIGDYAVIGKTNNPYNLPRATATLNNGVLTFIVCSTDEATVDLYSSVEVLLKLTSASATATLTNIQAADAGDSEGATSDAELLAFDGMVAGSDEIDQTSDYAKENAVAEESAPPHVHDWVVDEIIQPTKTATGLRTYKCSDPDCHETKDPDVLPIPEQVTSGITFSGVINVKEVVSDQITLSTKQMRTKYGNSSSYFIVATYQKYLSQDDGAYMLQPATTKIYTAADRAEDSSLNKDMFYFKELALYEMTTEYNLTAYFKNADGIVVGYMERTSSLAGLVAASTTTDTAIKTSYADMCNYGAAAQAYFGAQGTNSDLAKAALPTDIVGASIMAYASDDSVLPATYNTTFLTTQKIVPTTGFVSAQMKLNVGASNRIQYTIRLDNYDFDDCVIKVKYNSIYGTDQEKILTREDLIDDGKANNGQPKYQFYYDGLAIYDAEKTVTMEMYHNGTLEATSQYCIGAFVTSKLSDAELGPVLKAMEKFANSAAIGLKQGTIFS